MNAPNLLLRVDAGSWNGSDYVSDGEAFTIRLPDLLADNEEEYDGMRADWIESLSTTGELKIGGGAAAYSLITVIDPSDETWQEQGARNRAWKPRGLLCPVCAGSGRIYDGPPLDDGFHLPSREMAGVNHRRFVEGPFAACPRGCEMPEVRRARTAELTARIVGRRMAEAA